jgi:DHHC palmitoyltransferase
MLTSSLRCDFQKFQFANAGRFSNLSALRPLCFSTRDTTSNENENVRFVPVQYHTAIETTSVDRFHRSSTMEAGASSVVIEVSPSSPHDDDDNDFDEEDAVLLLRKKSSSSSGLLPVEPFQIDESEEPGASVASSSSSTSSQHHRRRRIGQQRNGQRNRRRRRNRKPPSTPRQALWRYCILSTLAVILTISCPQTILRGDSGAADSDNIGSVAPQSSHIVHKHLVALVLWVYMLTLLSFYILHGSDPGYITLEIMQQVCLEDGYSLLGQPHLLKECESDCESSNKNIGSTDDHSKGGQNDDDVHHSGNNQAVVVRSNKHQPIIRLIQSTSRLVGGHRSSSRSSSSGGGGDDDDPLASPLETLPAPPPPPTTTSTPNNISHTASSMSSTSSPRKNVVCKHCHFAPPLRSHHCRICGKQQQNKKHAAACVAMFDHHCDFVGTCIGERNHCRFWWFLTCQALAFHLCCNVIVASSRLGFINVIMLLFPSSATSSTSTSSFANHNSSNNATNASNIHLDEGFHYHVNVLLAVSAKMYLYPLMIMAFIMWFIHTFMALTNTTTFECIKGHSVMDLPHSKRVDQNLHFFCCQRDDAAVVWCRQLFGGGQGRRGNDNQYQWRPTVWYPPEKIIRDSDDWWQHPWQNKYWSCC